MYLSHDVRVVSNVSVTVSFKAQVDLYLVQVATVAVVVDVAHRRRF